MQLLTIEINGTPHYGVSDPYDPTLVHEFGAGASGLRAAVEFLNSVWLAQHAAEMAGWSL